MLCYLLLQYVTAMMDQSDYLTCIAGRGRDRHQDHSFQRLLDGFHLSLPPPTHIRCALFPLACLVSSAKGPFNDFHVCVPPMITAPFLLQMQMQMQMQAAAG
jgi:hypothetical protein